MKTWQELDEIGREIVDSAFKVYSTLGPGLLEQVYEKCMIHELRKRSLVVQDQVVVPVHYDEIRLETGLRLDILVENTVIVELKAVEKVLPVHTAQVLTYLKLADCSLGYLVNFNTTLIKDGIKRVAL